MKSLDEIKHSTLTVMTWEMLVLFAYEGCMPTVCHACGKILKVGSEFKLVPHEREEPKDEEVGRRIPSDMRRTYRTIIDEMCCIRCGPTALARRDRAQEKDWRETRSGGFGRPSTKTT